MGLSVVRCPLCDRRYNVTGIPSGTKVLCTSCKAVLTVPASALSTKESLWRRFIPQTGAGQLMAALVGGLVLAGGGYSLFSGLRESRPILMADLQAPATDAPQERQGDPESPWATLPPTLQREFDPEKYQFAKVEPFILIGEKHPQVSLNVVFDLYGDLLPKLYKKFQEDFGGPLGLKRIDGQLPIVLYTRRDSFEKWWMRAYGGDKPPKEVPGAYSYMERRVGLYHDRDRGIRAITAKEVLLHEAIHQIVHRHYAERMSQSHPQPWWFQEGLATYFEGCRQNGRGEVIIDPSATTARLPAVKELVAANRIIPLQQLMGWNVDDIWKDWLSQGTQAERDKKLQTMQYAYAQSWALIHFLRHGKEGKYRELFNEYFKCELDGRGSKDVFKDLLREKHGMEFGELERDFCDYVANKLE